MKSSQERWPFWLCGAVWVSSTLIRKIAQLPADFQEVTKQLSSTYEGYL